MSLDLCNSAGARWLATNSFWHDVLVLAKKYGWTPLRTTDPLQPGSAEGWQGGYHVNNGELVNAEDARNFAVALRRALDTMPDRPSSGWVLNGEGRQHLEVLVAFLLQGAFRIY